MSDRHLVFLSSLQKAPFASATAPSVNPTGAKEE